MHRIIKALTLTIAVTVALTAAVCAALAVTENAYADMTGENGKTIRSAVVNIPVRHRITGDKYDGEDTFEFLLTAQDDKCPMPEGSSGRVRIAKVTGAGDPDFGDMVFEYPDEYHYTVSRQDKKYSNLDTDNSVYSVMIAKFNDGTTEMIIWNERGEKVEEICYTDQYRAPAAPARRTPKTGDEALRTKLVIYSFIALGAAVCLVALAAAEWLRRRSGREKGGWL